MAARAFITGVSGITLTADERDFMRASRPRDFNLFKRNIETPTQVIVLLTEFRERIDEPGAPVLIDQERGRRWP